MTKFSPSDEGKVIDGRVVVFLWPNAADAGPAPEAENSPAAAGPPPAEKASGAAAGESAGAGDASGATAAAAQAARPAAPDQGEEAKPAAPAPAASAASAGAPPASPSAAPAPILAGRTMEMPQDAPEEKPGPEQPPEVSPSTLAELGAASFDTSRTFLLPGSIEAFKKVLRFCKDNPGDKKILVAGHSDARAGQERNLQLSEARARSVVDFLKQDVDAWLKNWKTPKGSDRWDTREEQFMIKKVTEGKAATDPSATKWIPFKDARDKPGKAMTPSARRELVAAYMALAGEKLGADLEPEILGCGEWHPKDPDNPEDRVNRRVDVFVFQGSAIKPDPGLCRKSTKRKETRKGAKEKHCEAYDQWMGKTTELAAVPDSPGAGAASEDAPKPAAAPPPCTCCIHDPASPLFSAAKAAGLDKWVPEPNEPEVERRAPAADAKAPCQDLDEVAKQPVYADTAQKIEAMKLYAISYDAINHGKLSESRLKELAGKFGAGNFDFRSDFLEPLRKGRFRIALEPSQNAYATYRANKSTISAAGRNTMSLPPSGLNLGDLSDRGHAVHEAQHVIQDKLTLKQSAYEAEWQGHRVYADYVLHVEGALGRPDGSGLELADSDRYQAIKVRDTSVRFLIETPDMFAIDAVFTEAVLRNLKSGRPDLVKGQWAGVAEGDLQAISDAFNPNQAPADCLKVVKPVGYAAKYGPSFEIFAAIYLSIRGKAPYASDHAVWSTPEQKNGLLPA